MCRDGCDICAVQKLPAASSKLTGASLGLIAAVSLFPQDPSRPLNAAAQNLTGEQGQMSTKAAVLSATWLTLRPTLMAVMRMEMLQGGDNWDCMVSRRVLPAGRCLVGPCHPLLCVLQELLSSSAAQRAGGTGTKL